MAGERLYSEFKDDDSEVWRVSIYDTNPTWNAANAVSFSLGGEGFILKYTGNNEQQYQAIIGSSVELTMFEQVSGHTQTLDLLYSQPEGRLLLEIYRDPRRRQHNILARRNPSGTSGARRRAVSDGCALDS